MKGVFRKGTFSWVLRKLIIDERNHKKGGKSFLERKKKFCIKSDLETDVDIHH